MPTMLAERLRRLSPAEFRAFYEGRPEEERWELFDGIPLQMMTPPFLVHNRMADELVRLLNDALSTYDPSRIACQRPGLELPESGNYRPEPDVAVMDYELPPDGRYVTHAYLLAEIPSANDRERVPGSRETRIEAKRRIYRQHAACEAVLTLEQDRVQVLVETRTPEGWTSRTLKYPDGALVLPTFGLRCRVGDLYRSTPLASRRGEGVRP